MSRRRWVGLLHGGSKGTIRTNISRALGLLGCGSVGVSRHDDFGRNMPEGFP